MDVLLVLGTFVVSFVLQHLALYISLKYALFFDKNDTQKPQRCHDFNASRGGGIGIIIAFITASLYFDTFAQHFEGAIIGFGVGGFCVFLGGFLEDITGRISPLIRLCAQSVGALIAIIALGALVVDIGLGVMLPFALALPFSVFCIVGVCNAMNILDGFNGLTSGIALMALAMILLISDNALVHMHSLLLCCAIAGFFVCNFPHGRIFLGDGGAYFIGFMLALLLIVLTQSTDISAWFGVALLIHPLFEVVFSIVRKRFVHHISPFAPDNRHLHSLIYRKLTHSSPATSLCLYALNLPFMLCALLFARDTFMLMLLCATFAVIYVALYIWLVHKEPRRENCD
ncbi:MAG: undecaprenyl/decaprenyl-phosphate alpha-N-acetylglucosaminyl 1-phosphate transferase [Helicobacter sp.]|nr:undecaprenyl/decaprenyl-phosphate alpha-N-acetylglucosaminyl 1-phosphate transferase [Helicobacter sp.]